jgi:hypothetical protein
MSTAGRAYGAGDLTATDDATEFTLVAQLSGQGVLVGETPHPLELEWFSVTGYFNAVAGTSEVQLVNAIAVFTPRLAAQQAIFVDDSQLVIKPLVAVIVDGTLVAADRTSTFQLPSNTAALNLGANGGVNSSDGMGNLIWDVSFSTVSFSGSTNPQQLPPLAFISPVDATPVCLTSANLDVVSYQLPNQSQAPTPAQRYGTVLSLAGRQAS